MNHIIKRIFLCAMKEDYARFDEWFLLFMEINSMRIQAAVDGWKKKKR